jgi:hypothetical protein
MVGVATSLYGETGLICFPSAINDTIYFVDEDIFAGSYIGGCLVRTYSPGGGLNNNLFPDTLYSVTGMNTVHAENSYPTLSFVASRTDVSGDKIYIYNPVEAEWTSGTPSDVVLTNCFPITFSISGDTTEIIASFATDGAFTPGIFIYNSLLGDGIAAWTKITTDNVEIPSGWFIKDMTYATSRGIGSAGRIYVNTIDPVGVSSAVIMYTLPAAPPYTTGSWSDVTPVCLSSGTIFFFNADVKFCHITTATRATTGSGTDNVFLRYGEWDDTYTSSCAISLRHISGTIWEYTGIVPSSDSPEKMSVFSEIGGNLLCGSTDVAL